ncbi:hypothetical protein Tco_0934237 [Tanacetum coccineum]
MLKVFNREELVKLWSLFKEKFSLIEPTDDKERILWVEFKRLFEPNTDDTLWKLQRYMHDLLKWRLYDTCGVHHVSTERGMDIFMLVEKEYLLSKGVLMLMLVKKLLVEQSSEMANGIRNVPPNGVFGNEVYGSDSEGFGMNPSSNEFRLCNSDEWRSGNHGGRVIIRGYGGGGDMVVRHGLKGCLDHQIIRSSPSLPLLL